MTEETATQRNKWKLVGLVIVCTAGLIAGGYLMPSAWTAVIASMFGLL